MSWIFRPAFDAGHRAALRSGTSLLYVAPPAAWSVRPMLEELPPAEEGGLHTLVLAPTSAEGDEVAREAATVQALGPVHTATGLSRTCRVLDAGIARTLFATPGSALQLLRRSALQPSTLSRIIILWPEWHEALGEAEALDTVLAEAAGIQRLIATSDDTAVADFLERHARRAPLLRTTLPPERPFGRARAAIVESGRRRSAVIAILDQMNPGSAFVWDPSVQALSRWSDVTWDPTITVGHETPDQSVDLAIAAELPSAEAYAALTGRAKDVVVLCTPRQVSYLSVFVHSVSSYRLPSEADRASEWLADVRERVRHQVDAGGLEPHLFAIAPLLEEFDPALIAAALLTTTAEPAGAESDATTPAATWTHIRITAGRRERIRAGDLVGALLNAVGLSKTQVGRVDVRENFTVVEVRSEVADRAKRGLDGVTLRGTRVRARFDDR